MEEDAVLHFVKCVREKENGGGAYQLLSKGTSICFVARNGTVHPTIFITPKLSLN
jgi:hypothetical protein